MHNVEGNRLSLRFIYKSIWRF